MTGLSDTPSHLMERQARIIRELGSQKRLDALRSQCRFVVELAETGIRRRHPEWTQVQVRSEVARRWLTPEEHARWTARVAIIEA